MRRLGPIDPLLRHLWPKYGAMLAIFAKNPKIRVFVLFRPTALFLSKRDLLDIVAPSSRPKHRLIISRIQRVKIEKI